MTENELHWSNISSKTRSMIMIGLAMGLFVACLDGTIISTCAKTISESMSGTDLYAWIFTAYMLAETIMIPIAGKLSDQFGRKNIFLIGLVLFLVGSVLAANSMNMYMFIGVRALQGIGAGIMMPVAMSAVADLYAPEKRGRIQGSLGAIFGIATVIGPILGGVIADSIGWQWVFYVNIPIGLVALWLTRSNFPKMEIEDHGKVDLKGMAVLGLLLTDVLLLFTWGGNEFSWVGSESLAMATVAVALMVVFVAVERRAVSPILDLKLFKSRTFVGCSIGLFIFALGMMGLMAYMSLFMQVVMGYSATNAGMMMIPMVIGMMITSILSGSLLPKTGPRIWLTIGPILACIGMLLLSTISATTSLITILPYLFIVGVGLGCVMSVLMTTVQNSAAPGEVGMTTSGASLFRSIGGTVATGLFATIINTTLSSKLAEVLPTDIYDMMPHTTGILDHLGELGMYVGDVINAFSESVTFTFMIGGIITIFVIVAAIFLKKGGQKNNDEEKDIDTLPVD